MIIVCFRLQLRCTVGLRHPISNANLIDNLKNHSKLSQNLHNIFFINSTNKTSKLLKLAKSVDSHEKDSH